MNKKFIIIGSVVMVLLLLGGVVWWMRIKATQDLQPTKIEVQGASTTKTVVEDTKAAVEPYAPISAISPEATKEFDAGMKDLQALGKSAAIEAVPAETIVPEPVPTSEIVPIIDADSDGLTADQEATLGTDPNKADTDGDGLTDRQEVETYKTDPLKADTDGDNYSDGSEVQSGYNPLGSGKCVHTTCIP